MSSRKPRNKSQRKIEQKKRKRRERLKRKLDHEPPMGGDILIFDPPGMEKMSAVITEYIKPYLQSTHDIKAVRKLVAFAAVAWNAALMPAGERRAVIDDVVSRAIPGPTRDDLATLAEIEEFLVEMIDRKETDFAMYDRAIVDFEVQDLGTTFYLQVVSTLGSLPTV